MVLETYGVNYVIINDIYGNIFYTSASGELLTYASEMAAAVLLDYNRNPDVIFETDFYNTGFMLADSRTFMICTMPILLR